MTFTSLQSDHFAIMLVVSEFSFSFVIACSSFIYVKSFESLKKCGSEVFQNFFLILFIWLHRVFLAAHRLSLAVNSGDSSLLGCMAFLWWRLLLRAKALSTCALVVAACGLSSCGSSALKKAGFCSCGTRLSCSAARGIFPGQGSNPHPLHWQVNSYPLYHQGSPKVISYLLNSLLSTGGLF